jgi:glycosyltransferase involved in cell wall biosynthesis
MPKVSIVIPAYNAMKYLPETIDSVLGQTFTDYEVIIVDDGSKDDTVQWASSIPDPRFRVVAQANQGTPGARNTGITQSTGEYIAFLDADDLWAPTKLAEQAAVLDSNPSVGLVDTWTILVDQLGKPTGKLVASEAEGEVWKLLVEYDTVCGGSTVMLRRSCFERVGLFDIMIKFAEDWDMWIRVSEFYHFAVVRKPLVSYRTSKSKNCSGMENDFRAIIEKAFRSAPIDLLPLRNRSYGRANLYLAWKALDNRDAAMAVHYYQMMLSHCPSLRFTPDAVRLLIAILGLQLLKPKGYVQAMSAMYSLRRILLQKWLPGG